MIILVYCLTKRDNTNQHTYSSSAQVTSAERECEGQGAGADWSYHPGQL